MGLHHPWDVFAFSDLLDLTEAMLLQDRPQVTVRDGHGTAAWHTPRGTQQQTITNGSVGRCGAVGRL